MQDKEIFYPLTLEEWRKWLEKNHDSKPSVWLQCNSKKSGLPALQWGDLVDVALCFGWIDSTRKTVGENRFIQLFSRRKPSGTWSKINKEKVQRLIDQGLMMPAGLEVIEVAKKNGSWNILDEVEALIIPEDMESEFLKRPGSKDYFLSLSKSMRKMMLHWVVLAKRPETRNRRIEEIAEASAAQRKPERFET